MIYDERICKSEHGCSDRRRRADRSGAGLWLARLGVRVRIIDKTAEAGTTSRALAVQARTLELYSQLGLADDGGRARAQDDRREYLGGGQEGGAIPSSATWAAGLSPFPYALIFPQDEHERLLIERLAEAGVKVERRTELVGFEDADDRVLARLKRPDGSEETCEAAYIAGCDGARSTVREALGIGFPGGTYEHSSMSPTWRRAARR